MRHLIAAGEITDGTVDERSIAELRGGDLADARRVHLFAGIAGWDLALQLAGWPADRPVWTGSCPCQPFSSAGARGGTADARHLWPDMFRLIRECRPATVFGEQVGGRLGLEWLAGVRADLESEGYAFAAADLPAACVGAPHIRQRLFWVADADERRQAGSQRRGVGEVLQGGVSIGAARDWKSGEASDETLAKNARPLNEVAVAATGWPTPQSRDGDHARGGLESRTGGRRRNLDDYVKLVGWGTPRSVETGHSSGNPDRATDRLSRLEDQVHGVAGWRTPDTAAGHTRGLPNSPEVQAKRLRDGRQTSLADQGLGAMPTGSPAPTEKRGALNPAFTRWLMGFPPEWDACAPTATRSSRKSRPSS